MKGVKKLWNSNLNHNLKKFLKSYNQGKFILKSKFNFNLSLDENQHHQISWLFSILTDVYKNKSANVNDIAFCRKRERSICQVIISYNQN